LANRVNKRIVIIADPNRAGKTTFAREFLPNGAGGPIFINATRGWSICGSSTTTLVCRLF
jgi:hypothetical protein